MSNFVKPAIGSVGQYQMSGKPFVRSFIVGPDLDPEGYGAAVEFPNVTKAICIKDNSSTGSAHDNMLLHFTADAEAARASGEYYIIKPGEFLHLNVRCRRMYISHLTADAGGNGGHQTSVSICAELTNIEDEISYE